MDTTSPCKSTAASFARDVQCPQFASFVENEMVHVWRDDPLEARLVKKLLDTNGLLNNFLLKWTFPFKNGSQKAVVILEVIASDARYRDLVGGGVEASLGDQERLLRKSPDNSHHVETN